MKNDKRLDNIKSLPSGHVAITKEKQVEVIYQAVQEVFEADGHITRRIPFNEDYRDDSAEE